MNADNITVKPAAPLDPVELLAAYEDTGSWWKACHSCGVSQGGARFRTAREQLLQDGLIQKHEHYSGQQNKYTITDKGRERLEEGMQQ